MLENATTATHANIAPLSEQSQPRHPHAIGSTVRVLVVDEQSDFRTILQMMMLRAGFMVRCATGAFAALASIRTERPDVVVLDAMMRDMDGLHLCVALQNDPAMRDIPIVLITHPDDTATQSAAMRLGVTEFLSKPVDRNLLRECILRQLQQ